MKEEIKEPQNMTPFQKFESLAKRLLAVPKKEVEEKIKEFRERPQKKQSST